MLLYFLRAMGGDSFYFKNFYGEVSNGLGVLRVEVFRRGKLVVMTFGKVRINWGCGRYYILFGYSYMTEIYTLFASV